MMTSVPKVQDEMLAAIPSLRAFAISLCGNVDHADDLVQETICRALTHVDSFQPGTNLRAWLFTILRNLFYSDYRKRRRQVEDVDGHHADRLHRPPDQDDKIQLREMLAALQRLQPDQREALILVGAAGCSYQEAAAISDCAVGTIKSRVNRARMRLAELLDIEGPDDFGAGHVLRAVHIPDRQSVRRGM
jgi:RNA polymerase sigma-70 factor (ECF subfamily)